MKMRATSACWSAPSYRGRPWPTTCWSTSVSGSSCSTRRGCLWGQLVQVYPNDDDDGYTMFVTGANTYNYVTMDSTSPSPAARRAGVGLAGAPRRPHDREVS